MLNVCIKLSNLLSCQSNHFLLISLLMDRYLTCKFIEFEYMTNYRIITNYAKQGYQLIHSELDTCSLFSSKFVV